MGFEPTTSYLGSKHSTAELHPPVDTKCSQEVFTRQLLGEFITSRASGTSSKTITLYHYALNRFIGYPLTAQGINEYLNNLTCGNGKHNYYRCIKTLCSWLYQNDYIAVNPIKKVSPPRRQGKLLPAICQEQLNVLLEHCHCDRDRALLSFLWYSGCRVSEAANVRASDFNWSEGTVLILGKSNKFRKALSGNGDVRHWFAEHNSFELNTRGIKTMVQRLSKETGIRFSCHALRRGFCVHNAKAGLSTRVVQSLGGWETISMVERYSKSLTFDDALQLYKQVNGSPV